jgi:hypothetical protein
MQVTFNENEVVLRIPKTDEQPLFRTLFAMIGKTENDEQYNVVRNLFDTVFASGLDRMVDTRIDFDIVEPRAVIRRV